jgi:hypothetical protein
LAITVMFPATDQTPSEKHGRGRSDARQPNRIKDAGGRSKQEGGILTALQGKQVVDIPGKILTRLSIDTSRETGSGQNSIASHRDVVVA